MFKKGCRRVSILHWRITYLAQMNSKQGFTYKGKRALLILRKQFIIRYHQERRVEEKKGKKKFHFSHRPISLRLLCSKRPLFCPPSIRKKELFENKKELLKLFCKKIAETVIQARSLPQITPYAKMCTLQNMKLRYWSI